LYAHIRTCTGQSAWAVARSKKMASITEYKLLLGALEARSEEGKRRLHSSDFQAAINQLGYTFGNSFIDKVRL
jgi:hypothetical protein